MVKISEGLLNFYKEFDPQFLDSLKNLDKLITKGLSEKSDVSTDLISTTGITGISKGLTARLSGLISGNNKVFFWFGVIVVIILLMWRRRRNKERGKTYILSYPVNAQDEYHISAKEAPLINEGTGIASTLNMWFKIDDWNFKFNEDKYIVIRQGLYIFMAPQSPDLTILIETHDVADSNQRLVIKNVPIQRWNNLALTFDGRMVDIWLNGELRLSNQLKNLPNIRDEGQMVMCPYGGFYGQIGQMFVSEKPMRRREIVHLWRNGARRTGRLRLHNPALKIITKVQTSKKI